MRRLLANPLFYFNVKLKGPRQLREATPQERMKMMEKKREDFFSPIYKDTQRLYKNNFTEEELKDCSESVKRVFSLENASPAEILKYKIQEAVRKYQIHSVDHGSQAVQAAILSERIIFQMMHTKKYPKDAKAGRFLVEMVDKRRKLLIYLMKNDIHRYKWVCKDYGIPELHAKKFHSKRFGRKENSWVGKYT